MAKHHIRLLWTLLFVVLFLIHTTSIQFRRVQEATDFDRLQEHPYHFVPTELQRSSSSDGHLSLPSVLVPYADVLRRSDIVQLQHCLQTPWPQPVSLWKNFKEWAVPILRDKWDDKKEVHMSINTTAKQLVKDEFTMQMLEIYLATYHTNLCNYSEYQFHRFPFNDDKKRHSFETALQKIRPRSKTFLSLQDNPSVRIVFSIVAYQDAEHLQRLVQTIWMPQHLIVLHIEEHTPLQFQEAVHGIADRYSNVIVLQFGTIVYETDSVSQVNLEIFEWLNTIDWEFDYAVTLGGATFPLWNATALNQYLYNAKLHGQQVWLGELLHNSQRVHHPQATLVWNRKRLYTSIAEGEKLSLRLGNIVSTLIPQWLNQAMHYKSTSGNQGIYSFEIVKRLLKQPQIKQLFALAKYGCCCCLEERTWIAAIGMMGLLEQAKENYSMFQLWGAPAVSAAGSTESVPCHGGMKNSVLEINTHPHSCYRSEHAYDWVEDRPEDGPMRSKATFMMNATEVWERLVEAKSRGTLFARKFHSSNEQSVLMIQKVVQELH
ncbi:core-2/I-branching enzyme [Nitzschia inconspicua]|uniref:Core-2/I-branching enzyme n=1 Tax=Nitzschia inconspicua TaxID=303405 RepID=A0A9K3PWD0_9STRA|nr:core-2/I-branching enzyme [Nitzschia inconspicua]